MGWGVRPVDPERVPWYLGAIWALLVVVLTAEIAHQLLALGPLTAVSAADLPWPYVVSFTITLPFLAGLGYGAWYLTREPFPPARNRRIFGWSLGGAAVWLVINALTLASFGFAGFWPVVGWIRGALAFGTTFGLTIGVLEARAVTKAVEAEQARLRAKHLSEQRDLVDYVNSLIRHEVLNGLTVIQGRAELLARTGDEETATHVEPIIRRSEEIESVVTEVRTIMESVHREPEFEPTNLRAVLRGEAAKLRDLDSDVEVSITVPGDLYVRGDDTLGLVFGNLLTNAVEHDDSGSPHVRVSVTAADEVVHVHVADDGPGIDPDLRDGLFDRPDGGTGDHGFGLYLVAHLCERYGGGIELTDTGSDGTTFTVTLPVASDAPDTQATPPAVTASD